MQVHGQAHIVRSADSIQSSDVRNNTNLYPVEFLNSINISGVPPHKMTLKVHLFNNNNTTTDSTTTAVVVAAAANDDEDDNFISVSCLKKKIFFTFNGT